MEMEKVEGEEVVAKVVLSAPPSDQALKVVVLDACHLVRVGDVLQGLELLGVVLQEIRIEVAPQVILSPVSSFFHLERVTKS